jgi:alkanesulfonate monooxygenase SsuD/methylene tetrahydromethanopterin reductase-like flavin-dependent oxidoreductase (luciferase family)
MCAIAETDEQAALKIGSLERDAQGKTDLSRLRERALIGTPEAIRRRLAAYEQAGAQEIIVYIPDAATLESVRLFARTCLGT